MQALSEMYNRTIEVYKYSLGMICISQVGDFLYVLRQVGRQNFDGFNIQVNPWKHSFVYAFETCFNLITLLNENNYCQYTFLDCTVIQRKYYFLVPLFV